jgi:hypothetical protein
VRFYCGNTINATIDIPLNFPQEMIKRIVVLGEIRPINDNYYHIWLTKNTTVDASKICNDIDDTTFSRFRGTLLIDSISSNQKLLNSVDVKFDNKPWSYQWTANRWHVTDHVFEISILVPNLISTSSKLTVVSQFTGPSFRIGCTRRLNCGENGAHKKKIVIDKRKRDAKGSSKAFRHSKYHESKPILNKLDTNLNKKADSCHTLNKFQESDDSDSDDEPFINLKRQPTTRFLTKASIKADPYSFDVKEIMLTQDSCEIETKKDSYITNSDESAALLTNSDACLMSEEDAGIIPTDETASSVDISISPDIFIVAAERMLESINQSVKKKQEQSELNNFGNLFESAQKLLSTT